MFIDTHCHLYLPEFAEDLPSVIHRAQQEMIHKFYLPAIDSSTHQSLFGVQARFPGVCVAMMGLHPTSVKEDYEDELRIVEEWLQQRTFAAVGEIGLDFYWDQTFKVEQIRAFEKQIDWALLHDYPIVIHSRNAVDQCIEVVQSKQTGALTGIFHCFSGTLQQAKAIIETGLYLGIGGVLTYKNSGLAQVIDGIDLEHLVLETDAPYLAPVPFRGKRNESSYLKYVIEKLAIITGTSAEEIGRITSRNAENIFRV